MKALNRFIEDDWLGVHFAVNVFLATTLLWLILRRVADLNPIWAISSMIAASDPVIRQAAKTFRGRIINALLGCAVGVTFLVLGGSQEWKLPLALAVTVLLSTYVVRVQVMWRQAPITAAIVIAAGMTHHSELTAVEFGLRRVGEVLLGCVVGLVVSWLMSRLWPVPEGDKSHAPPKQPWHRMKSHPITAEETPPRITHTPAGIPGDPLNVALPGSESNLMHAMTGARWAPADDLTFRRSLRIAVDSVFRRPDPDAPVSTLELFGRKQDLAFEQLVGNSPRQRHHVRFWHWDPLHEGREVWFGAITFDEHVGLSHTAGQVTHHIGPDLDAERDRLFDQFQQAGVTQEIFWLGASQQLQGKNGGGDPWHTDGRLEVATLAEPSASRPAATNKATPP